MTYTELAKERDELKQEIERLNYEYDRAFKRLKIQQQEIDRLRENEKLKTKFVKNREVKAVKEFAEKLKGIAFDNCKLGGHCQEVVDCDDIDGLLQECGVDVEK